MTRVRYLAVCGCRPRPGGFALVELLVVLACTAILSGSASLAAAALRPRFALWQAERQIRLELALARARALTESTDVRVRFEVGGGTYRVERRSTAGFEAVTPALTLPASVTLRDCTARDDTIQFGSRGTATTFGSVTLAAGDATRRIVVTITGNARGE